MPDYEKAAVPIPSVGADGEQQLSQMTEHSITEPCREHKPPQDAFFEKMRRMQRLYDPNRLNTVTMSELYENVYQNRPPIIDGLLHVGTYLFAGAPKIGKSYFMAQLAYHVSSGIPLWDYPVHKGTVLYLALEDDHRRLQARLFRMFGTEAAENLYFATDAKQLGAGLDEQLEKFLREHPETKLVIIDTLQKIREAQGGQCSYASDYDVIGRLKQFAGYHGICLLLVHHTRKQQAEDKFDMISGTNGLLGCADGAFLLHKEKRTDNTATLDVSGRDQQDQRLYLIKNVSRLTWELERMETELWKPPPDPVLETVAGFLTEDRTKWSGTATELAAALGLDMKPNTLSMRLNVNVDRLRDEYGVAYEATRSHAGRKIILSRMAAPA